MPAKKKSVPKSAKVTKPSQGSTRSLAKPLAWILVVGGIIGFISSFIITVDKIKLLENPSFQPNCDLNPIISCGSVMASAQGSVFGFPNPWIGLSAFAVLITIGVAIFAGAKFKRWFWLGLEGGVILGVIFALWLLYESIYVINALCPYCLIVDVVVLTTLWYTTLYLIESKMITVPARLQRAATFARQHHLDILILTFVVIIAVILNHFWYYYGQYL